MRRFLIALSFFTRFSIKVDDVQEKEFYESMILMPLIGVIIGGLLALAAWILSMIHNPQVSAIVLILIYIAITGGLHFDGVADTTDAIFSARDHKRMMEIMKDSRLGSFGAMGLILLFFTLWTGYSTLISQGNSGILGILLLPVVGRYCAIQSCCFTSYAEGGGDLGRRIIEMSKPWHVSIYFFAVLVYAWVLNQWILVIAILVTMIANFILMFYLQKRIGGFTGDTIGLTIEVNQAFFAVVLSILIQNWSCITGCLS